MVLFLLVLHFRLSNVLRDSETSDSLKYSRVVRRVDDFRIHDDRDGCFGRYAGKGVSKSEALQKGLDIVVAGHEYAIDFPYPYLWDLKLWNTRITVYRRERGFAPIRTWYGPCGMVAQERILLPNHGRDGAAFYDFLLWRYDDPPLGVVFLHGHAALGWHTSCETIFSRILAYYHSVIFPEIRPLPNAIITLTFARGRKDTKFQPLFWNGGRRLHDSEQHPEATSCLDVLDRANVSLTPATASSCCGSFILSGGAFRRHSRQLYSILLDHVQDVSLDDEITGRECFEYIVYGLFDRPLTSNGNGTFDGTARDELESWYSAAKRLRPKILSRLRGCESSYGHGYLGDDNRLVLGTFWFPARRYVQG